MRALHQVILLLTCLALVVSAAGDKYLLGAGKGDITGPTVEVPFHGYAVLEQKGTGLRQRLYARSFIIGDVNKPSDRFVYIIVDTMGGDTAVRNGILDGLANLGKEYGVYNSANVALVGTHSHSGPGGWHNYVLTQIPSLGFNKQSFQAIVDGAVLSVKRAHESLQEGYIDVGTTDVQDGNINRSLWAYLANPQAERNLYPTNTDTQMTLLRLKRASDSKVVGILNWYAVHGTSLYNNNTLVTGDNKGVAAWLFEKDFGATDAAAPGFVAGFSQANVGDVSPNVLGAWCEDGSGQQCTQDKSTCNGRSDKCHARGPNFRANDQGTSSCYEMGRRQYAAAKNIMTSLDTSGTPITGSSVKFFHFFQDMRYFKFSNPDGSTAQTCPGALGYSFAAGTTDGPGVGDFSQSDAFKPNANPFWQLVSAVIRVPSERQKACQGTKPILLDVGEMDFPFPWSANIVDLQLLRVGQFVIIVSPAEASTMSGRRWRKAVGAAAKTILDGPEPIVVIGGPANTYTHYAVTPEEYDIQRYEGASTLFGKWTLNAYINLTVGAINFLSPSATAGPNPGPIPGDNRGKSTGFITEVVYDNPAIGRKLGQVLSQPKAAHARGDVVAVKFQGANPRNNLRLEGTFVAVEQLVNGAWVRVRDDSDWFLVYNWKRTDLILGASEVTVKWETGGDGAPAGTYRIRYYGDRKAPGSGRIEAFEGVSNVFSLV